MSVNLLCSVLGCAILAAPIALADDYRLAGPYKHDNLTIYLIQGVAKSQKQYLTLQDALEQHKVAVYETGSVNELAIENLSDRDIYIQSGDIVKGGKQDRVFPDDFILPTKSGKVSISSFCVEHGRWTRRGNEATDQFHASNQALPTKALKMAARDARSQSGVWNEVAVAQQKFSALVSGSVAAPASPTSMQLTLENKQVADVSGAYIDALSHIVDAKPDAIGYVFAINGRVNSAELYSSNQLFLRMWPKLLRASSIEAMTERRTANALEAPDPASIRAFLRNAGIGSDSTRPAGPHAIVVRKDSDSAVMFESKDASAPGWVHRSYMSK